VSRVGDALTRLLLTEPPTPTGNPIVRILDCLAKLEPILLVPILGLIVADGNRRLGEIIIEGVSGKRVLVGSAEIALATLLLWKTVSRWARWVPAFMVLGALRAGGSLLTGEFQNRSLSRMESGLFIVYAVATLGFTFRYHSRQPKGFEKAALLIFMISTFPIIMFAGIYPRKSTPPLAIASVTIGVAALGLARLGVRRHRTSATSTT
jgi:hypothetical protein